MWSLGPLTLVSLQTELYQKGSPWLPQGHVKSKRKGAHKVMMSNQPSISLSCLGFPLSLWMDQFSFILCALDKFTRPLLFLENADHNLIQLVPPILGTILLVSKLASFLGFSGPYMCIYWGPASIPPAVCTRTFIACDHMPGTKLGAWEVLMYLLVRILLVAGDKNAAQMDLSKKL